MKAYYENITLSEAGKVLKTYLKDGVEYVEIYVGSKKSGYIFSVLKARTYVLNNKLIIKER